MLGVSESASAGEIKKAYRKMARANHPDSNPGDKSKESRFKDISAAYEILGDADKRAQYDALKSAGPGAIPEGVFDLGDLFAQMFGGQAAPPAGGVHYEFRTASGAPAESRTRPQGFHFPDLGSVFGDFQRPPESEPAKKKKKKALTSRKLSDGTKASVRGLDLHSDVRIGVDQAILGAEATVATKNGKAKIKIPPGTCSGTVLRLRGKGLRASTDRVGNHYLTVQIDVPKKISDEAAKRLVQFMEAAEKDGD